MKPIFQKQNETADWIANEVLGYPPSESAVVNLAGAVGTGKTTVLQLVQDRIQNDKTTIFLSAPPTEVETSSILLAELSDSLESAGRLNGEASIVKEPTQRWNDKFEALTRIVDSSPDDFVVICDEPTRWFRRGMSEMSDTPDYHAKALSDWIFRTAKCRRVVSGSTLPSGLPLMKRTRAPKMVDGRELLNQQNNWYEAASLANSVSDAISEPLEFKSVMEIGLLVVWAWLFDVRDATNQISSLSTPSLLESLFDGLEIQKPDVCNALAQLSIPRHKYDLETFRELTIGLSGLDRDIIRACLCDETPDSIALHPLVSGEVVSRARDRHRWDTNSIWKLDPNSRSQVHSRLHDFFTKHTQSARLDIETLYHGVLANKLKATEVSNRLHFVEQLHEIGKSLSYEFRQHDHAAEVFRFALQLDDSNAYSHHYLAFNLDWMAKDAEEVELHYKRATELQPEHAWWWSRWISYLTTRGRNKEAREQWREAMDELSIGEDPSADWVYNSLHRWVARWMLHWGELKMAEEVLRSIPSPVSDDPSIKTLKNLLAALRLAEEGIAVFPLSVPHDQWWSRHRTDLPLIDEDGKRLMNWLPARIEEVDDSTAFLMVGVRPSNALDPVEVYEKELNRATFEPALHNCEWSTLKAGSFIELAYYGPNDELRIGLHTEQEWKDPDLLPLVPPANRWFDKAVKESWNETTRQ